MKEHINSTVCLKSNGLFVFVWVFCCFGFTLNLKKSNWASIMIILLLFCSFAEELMTQWLCLTFLHILHLCISMCVHVNNKYIFFFFYLFVIHKVLRRWMKKNDEKKKNMNKRTSTNLSFYVSHHLLSFIIVINIKKWLTY